MSKQRLGALIFVGAGILAFVLDGFVATDPTSGASWPSRGQDGAGRLRGRGRAALPAPARGVLSLDRVAEAVGTAAALGWPAVPVGSLVRVVAQEHTPGLAEVLVLVRRGGRWCRWR